MDKNLLKVRLVSFGYGLLSLVGMAVIGVLASSDFAVLVKTHFGEGIVTSFILLLVPELVKHIRNLTVLGKLGGVDEKKTFLI